MTGCRPTSGDQKSWSAYGLWTVGLIVTGCVLWWTPWARAQGVRWEHYMPEGAKAYHRSQETNAERF